jgi:Nuclease-related domain
MPNVPLPSTARRLGGRSERAQHAAARHEQRISNELADLPSGWKVVHSPVIEGFDVYDCKVDYVAIGPGGVFLLHLEHHPAAKVWVSEHKVTINGRDSDRLGKARFAARRSSTVLSEACGFDVIVQSVLVLIGASTMQLVSRPPEVHVRAQHDIHDWLCKQPPRLDPHVVSAISQHVHEAECSPTASTAGLVE